MCSRRYTGSALYLFEKDKNESRKGFQEDCLGTHDDVQIYSLPKQSRKILQTFVLLTREPVPKRCIPNGDSVHVTGKAQGEHQKGLKPDLCVQMGGWLGALQPHVCPVCFHIPKRQGSGGLSW